MHGPTLCLCVPVDLVKDEVMEDGIKADSGMQNQFGVPVCKNHDDFVEDLGYLLAAGGSGPSLQSQERDAAMKESDEATADKGDIFYLQGLHRKKSDQGRIHIKD